MNFFEELECFDKEVHEACMAELKRQRQENKARAKADKRQKKEERSKRRSSRGVGGWIAAVVSLGVVCLVLGSILVVNLFGGISAVPQNILRTNYNQYYEELIDYNQNIDTNLSKFFVSNSKGEQQRLLVKITQDSLLAEENLQRLPIGVESRSSTIKVINQIGDYANYLNNKLIDGLCITKSEKENLQRLYGYNKSIKEGFAKISNEISNGAKIEEVFKNDQIGGEVFSNLESMAVAYPQLIYDGPFSDGLNTSKPKALVGEEITQKQAEEIFNSIFTSYNITMQEVVGEYNGQIKSYTITAKDELGESVFAQISKQGGKLIMFDYNKKCMAEKNLSEEDCVSVGNKFLNDLGIKNIKAVWCETNESLTTINFACYENGVVLYPDLIKVNVCRKDGVVTGIEATNYYLNHTKRDIKSAKISSSEALEKINADLNVESIRLALIPKGSKEVLTYEVCGRMQGETYFVYVSAESGLEEQIFKVVTTSQGNLLI